MSWHGQQPRLRIVSYCCDVSTPSVAQARCLSYLRVRKRSTHASRSNDLIQGQSSDLSGWQALLPRPSNFGTLGAA
jgi:hypothetical protein